MIYLTTVTVKPISVRISLKARHAQGPVHAPAISEKVRVAFKAYALAI